MDTSVVMLLQVCYCQELSEYGSVRFKAVKVPIFGVDPGLRTQLSRPLPPRFSKGTLFFRVRVGGVPGAIEEFVRVRFCC